MTDTLAVANTPLKVGIFVCPGFFPGDIVGAHSVFGILPDVELHMVWKDLEPFDAMPRWQTAATTTFADCPDLDILVVGAVPPPIYADVEVIDFFRRKAEAAQIVIATCSGVLLLGVTGLLKGRRATSNFHMLDVLPDLGAIPVDNGKVVVDGKFYTAGPVMGSYEAAFMALAALRGEEAAKLLELSCEYEPHPPFNVGSPELAGPELTRKALKWFEPVVTESSNVARASFKVNAH